MAGMIFLIQWNQAKPCAYNTNVPLMRPSDPDLQRAMYSSYYAGCVGKGGVSLQLCGWTRTWPLATGAIDDSAYIKLVNVFELQQKFAENDKHAIIHLPICLIVDIVLFLMDCCMENRSVSSQPLLKVIRNLGQIVCFTWRAWQQQGLEMSILFDR